MILKVNLDVLQCYVTSLGLCTDTQQKYSMNFRESLGTDELGDDLTYALYVLQEVLRHSMQIAESLT